MNSRLDTIQAAILLPKLEIFAEEVAAREAVAIRYSKALEGVTKVPYIRKGAQSAWAQYTIITDDRDAMVAACKAAGVPTAIHYPIPLHMQIGYKSFPRAPGGLPNAEWLASRVVSLPMHPYLDAPTQDRIIAAVKGALVGAGKSAA